MSAIQELSVFGQETPVLDCDGNPIFVGDCLVSQNGAYIHVVSMACEEFPGYWHLSAEKQWTTMCGREGGPTFYHHHSHPHGALVDSVQLPARSKYRISKALTKRLAETASA